MPTAAVKAERNQSMELCKFIGAFLIVLIHGEFPGELGKMINCLGRFGVPMFFMITGYFNFQATSKQLSRRTWHIAKLFAIGYGVQILCDIIGLKMGGADVIGYYRWTLSRGVDTAKLGYDLLRWLFLHIPPRVGSLWYLNAIFAVYLVFGCFVRFKGEKNTEYGPFYILCLCAFAVFFALCIVAPAANIKQIGDQDISLIYRNGWFYGLPFFGLGLFIRQYQDRIQETFRLTTGKLLAMFLTGILLNVVQAKTMSFGEIPCGTILEVFALMMLMVSHPRIAAWTPGKKLILALGPISMWIYILHLQMIDFYNSQLQTTVSSVLGAAEPWLKPLMLAGVTLLMAIFCTIVEQRLHKLPKGREKRS